MIYFKRHLHCFHVQELMMAQALGGERAAWKTQPEVGDKAGPPHASLSVTRISPYHLLQENDSPYTYLCIYTVIALFSYFQDKFFFVLNNLVSRPLDWNEFHILSLNKQTKDSKEKIRFEDIDIGRDKISSSLWTGLYPPWLLPRTPFIRMSCLQ